MSDNNKTGRGFAGKGYYIALVLCAVAIGITGYLYTRNQNEEPQQVLQETAPEYISAGTLETEPLVEAIATRPTEKATVPTTAPAETTRPTEAPKKELKTRLPVSGQEIYGYSMETLSYNETTRDWRVHNGIDIAAEEGTPVCAAAEGTVIATREDDAMGCVVVIRHTGGYTPEYASLREDLAVQTGDTVTLGQTIGYVGDTALVETTLGTHVHFSVYHQEVPMDPAEFLALGQ